MKVKCLNPPTTITPKIGQTQMDPISFPDLNPIVVDDRVGKRLILSDDFEEVVE